MNGAPVTDESLKNFEGLTGCGNWSSTEREGRRPGRGRLAGLGALTELSLNGAGISDAGLESVGRLIRLQSFT